MLLAMTLALPELFVLLRTLSGHTHHTNRLSESYSKNAGPTFPMCDTMERYNRLTRPARQAFDAPDGRGYRARTPI
jgi:hypothetical protein